MNTTAEQTPKKRTKRSVLKDIGYVFVDFEFPGFVQQITTPVSGIIGLIGVIVGAFLLTPIGGDLPEVCAFQANFELPCPGCGLTRSVTSFLQLEFWMSFNYHPFGFVFGMIFILMAPFAFMTSGFRNKVRSKLVPYEKTMGRSFLIFATLLFTFGIIRLFLITAEVPGFAWWNKKQIPPFAKDYVEKQEKLPTYAPELYGDFFEGE